MTEALGRLQRDTTVEAEFSGTMPGADRDALLHGMNEQGAYRALSVNGGERTGALYAEVAPFEPTHSQVQSSVPSMNADIAASLPQETPRSSTISGAESTIASNIENVAEGFFTIAGRACAQLCKTETWSALGTAAAAAWSYVTAPEFVDLIKDVASSAVQGVVHFLGKLAEDPLPAVGRLCRSTVHLAGQFLDSVGVLDLGKAAVNVLSGNIGEAGECLVNAGKKLLTCTGIISFCQAAQALAEGRTIDFWKLLVTGVFLLSLAISTVGMANAVVQSLRGILTKQLAEAVKLLAKTSAEEIANRLGKDRIKQLASTQMDGVMKQMADEIAVAAKRAGGLDRISAVKLSEIGDTHASHAARELWKSVKLEATTADVVEGTLGGTAEAVNSGKFAIKLLEQGICKDQAAAQKLAAKLAHAVNTPVKYKNMKLIFTDEITEQMVSIIKEPMLETSERFLKKQMQEGSGHKLAQLADDAVRAGRKTRAELEEMVVKETAKGIERGIERETRIIVKKGVEEGFKRHEERNRRRRSASAKRNEKKNRVESTQNSHHSDDGVIEERDFGGRAQHGGEKHSLATKLAGTSGTDVLEIGGERISRTWQVGDDGVRHVVSESRSVIANGGSGSTKRATDFELGTPRETTPRNLQTRTGSKGEKLGGENKEDSFSA